MKDFLPAGEEGKEVTLTDLSGTVQSPQFQQSLSMFSMALSSGQLGPLIREFGLGDEAAAAATPAAGQGAPSHASPTQIHDLNRTRSLHAHRKDVRDVALEVVVKGSQGGET